MKKYDSIVKRVQAYEDKCCAEYQKIGGPLFKILRKLYVFVVMYAVCVNLLFITSVNWRKNSGNTEIIVEQHQLVFLGICTAALIASVILIYTPFKTTASIIGVATVPFMLHIFVLPGTDKLNGFLGYRPAFFYRHLISDLILMILLCWIIILAVRERIITNSRYKKIEANIYEAYRDQYTNKADFSITDEMWDEYIKNYDPRAYKNLDLNYD